MKITIEHYDNQYTVDLPEDIDVDEFIYNIKGLAFMIYGQQVLEYFDVK
jgi:hypothetical protein